MISLKESGISFDNLKKQEVKVSSSGKRRVGFSRNVNQYDKILKEFTSRVANDRFNKTSEKKSISSNISFKRFLPLPLR